MGLSCLFGHDFGHPAHEQEREQHGEEVVLTTRDVKTCRRCGSEQVITENTAVMKRDAVRAELDREGSDTEPTTESDDGVTSAEPATATEARTTRDSDPKPSGAQPDGLGSETESDEPEITDDAVILTDGSAEERQPMEWPEFRTAGESAGQSVTANRDSHSGKETNGSGTRFGAKQKPTELRCGGCDTGYDPTASSLRVGDLCPRCRSAYLTDSPE
jgi:Zn finger protein HypA/HybF involved in hydrogenase expression